MVHIGVNNVIPLKIERPDFLGVADNVISPPQFTSSTAHHASSATKGPQEESTVSEQSEASQTAEPMTNTHEQNNLIQDENELLQQKLQTLQQDVEKKELELELSKQRYQQAAQIFKVVSGDILNKARGEIIELAVSIARNIIQSEVKTHPDAIINMVKSAIEKLQTENHLTIKLNPDDCQLLENSPQMKMDNEIMFLPDAQLQPGDFIIDTGDEIFDGKISERISELRKSLEDSIMQESK